VTAVRAACLQMALKPSPKEAWAHAGAMASHAATAGAQLALLPEYWFLPRGDGPPRDPEGLSAGAREAVQDISRDLGLAIAGNALARHEGHLHNTLFVFDRGALVGQQDKLHPMPTEERWGVLPAHDLVPFAWQGARVGGVVCADVLHPEGVRILALRGAEVLLVPVMSWLKPNDRGKDARKAMFVARAYDNACFVLKAGSVSGPGPGRLVGRSLVAAPWGMLAEARDELGEEVVLADLDLDQLREERRRSLSLPRRRPEAYGALADPALQVARGAPEGQEPGFDIGGPSAS
jgi:predicted amidohydrolase